MKELSQIKPSSLGNAAKQAVFESSLTHIKYKYQGDEASSNLVAFNALRNDAINKNGGVFTGPVQVKTTTAGIVNVTAVDEILTINLGFGKFFRLNLVEPVNFIEIINAPPGIATTFTLILAQESFSEQYYINFVSNNDKVIKYYPSDFLYLGDFVRLGPYPRCRDIVTFSTLDGNTFFLSLTGLNYSGGGNSVYGTFIRSETNYITIDGEQYANGTVDIVADGVGGETTGDHHYPPNYPATGSALFKTTPLPETTLGAVLPAQYFIDFNSNPDSPVSMGGTSAVSDGLGGYREVVGYYGNDAIFGGKDVYLNVAGTETYMGFRNYVGDGLGGTTILETYEYEDGDVLAGPTNDNNITFADDGWYSIDHYIWAYGEFISLPDAPYAGTYTIKANGDFTVRTEYTYPEEGTILASHPRYLGRALDYNVNLEGQIYNNRHIFAPANIVADGSGKVRLEVTIQPGSFLPIAGLGTPIFENGNFTQFIAGLDTDEFRYSLVGCASCAPSGLPAPVCYTGWDSAPHYSGTGCDVNSYLARAIYDPTKWTGSSAPPPGQGYFRIEIAPRYVYDESSGNYVYYPSNNLTLADLTWVEFSTALS
jgi:hypothetical protein